MSWHGWDLLVEAFVAVGTVGLAVATFILVGKTKGMAEVSRDALIVGVRPLLVDPTPVPDDSPPEHLLFGAPGRISPTVARGRIFANVQPDGSMTQFSIAFENVGGGVAAIVGWRTEPWIHGGIHVSRKFVPVGALLRVNVSVHPDMPGGERFNQHQALHDFHVEVDYTSTYGGEVLTSVATIGHYMTQGPFVEKIMVKYAATGEVVATGIGSY